MDQNNLQEDLQNSQLDVVFFDDVFDVVDAIIAHHAGAISHQHDLTLVFELLAVSPDHLDCKNDRGDS